jgi:hypothetical protein
MAGKIEIYQDNKGEWRFRLKGRMPVPSPGRASAGAVRCPRADAGEVEPGGYRSARFSGHGEAVASDSEPGIHPPTHRARVGEWSMPLHAYRRVGCLGRQEGAPNVRASDRVLANYQRGCGHCFCRALSEGAAATNLRNLASGVRP